MAVNTFVAQVPKFPLQTPEKSIYETDKLGEIYDLFYGEGSYQKLMQEDKMVEVTSPNFSVTKVKKGVNEIVKETGTGTFTVISYYQLEVRLKGENKRFNIVYTDKPLVDAMGKSMVEPSSIIVKKGKRVINPKYDTFLYMFLALHPQRINSPVEWAAEKFKEVQAKGAVGIGTAPTKRFKFSGDVEEQRFHWNQELQKSNVRERIYKLPVDKLDYVFKQAGLTLPQGSMGDTISTMKISMNRYLDYGPEYVKKMNAFIDSAYADDRVKFETAFREGLLVRDKTDALKVFAGDEFIVLPEPTMTDDSKAALYIAQNFDTHSRFGINLVKSIKQFKEKGGGGPSRDPR